MSVVVWVLLCSSDSKRGVNGCVIEGVSGRGWMSGWEWMRCNM